MADDTDSTLRDLDRMALAEYAQRARREVPGPIPWALGLLTMRIEDAVDSACATYAGQQGLAVAGRESLADKVPAKLGLADYPDGTDDDWWDIADVVYESCLSVWRSGGHADDMFAAAKKAAQASIDAAAKIPVVPTCTAGRVGHLEGGRVASLSRVRGAAIKWCVMSIERELEIKGIILEAYVASFTDPDGWVKVINAAKDRFVKAKDVEGIDLLAKDILEEMRAIAKGAS